MNFRLSNIDSNDVYDNTDRMQNLDEIDEFEFQNPEIRRSESAADDYLKVCAQFM